MNIKTKLTGPLNALRVFLVRCWTLLWKTFRNFMIFAVGPFVISINLAFGIFGIVKGLYAAGLFCLVSFTFGITQYRQHIKYIKWEK